MLVLPSEWDRKSIVIANIVIERAQPTFIECTVTVTSVTVTSQTVGTCVVSVDANFL